MELKTDDLVMCTVKSIEGTTVFVDIEGNGSASIVMSEVAAGRIRNLREYVAPQKKIVCKVLRVINGHIELSLRRVTGKEREEILGQYQKERTFLSLLKASVSNVELAISKIKQKYELWKFYDEVRENSSLLGDFFNKEESQKLSKLLSEKKEKEKIAKKEFVLKSFSESGIEEIKSALSRPGLEIRYLGSSRFSISCSGKDFKEANAHIDSGLLHIEKMAKEKKLVFENLSK